MKLFGHNKVAVYRSQFLYYISGIILAVVAPPPVAIGGEFLLPRNWPSFALGSMRRQQSPPD